MQTDRRLNDRANTTLDIGLQDQHETGAAARIDDDNFRYLQQTGGSAVAEPFQESRPTAFVSRQLQYPAEFLAQWTVTSAHGPGRSLALFVKAAAADAWRTTLFVDQPSASPDPFPDLAVDKGGYAHRLSDEEFQHLSTDPAQLAEDLTSFWNRYPDPSAPVPPNLAAGDWTTGRNEGARHDRAQKAAQHIAETWAASPGPYRYRSAYRTRSGDALVFFSVLEHLVLATAPPASFNAPLLYRGQQVLPQSVTNGAHGLSVDVLYTLGAVISSRGRPARVVGGYSGPVGAARIG